jgi:hypothetical protein
MSLPSQSARASSRASAVSTRQRRNSPFKSSAPFLIVGVLVVIVWFTLRPTGGKPEDSLAGDPMGTAEAPVVSPETKPPVVEQEPAPVEIAQSGRNSSAPLRELPGATDPAPNEVDTALNQSAGSETPAGGVLTRALEQPGTTPPTTGTNPPTGGTPSGTAQPTNNDRVRLQIDTARRLVSENDRVGARTLLSRVLREPGLSPSEADLLRDELMLINQQLVFGRVVEPGDAMVEEYKVQSGDSLARISARRELATHWKLVQRVNGLSDPTKIRVDQKLKLVRGPFHAIVDKSDFRMDVWHGPPSDPSRWIYIRSFDVGLGEGGGTPVGTFVVSANKLENPGWVNPRDSRERYEPNDPRNPIGEFWLGLDGTGSSEGITGYGIHGTIDPGSIGQNKSMGCVRLNDTDIQMVYELLAEKVSRVEIVP